MTPRDLFPDLACRARQPPRAAALISRNPRALHVREPELKLRLVVAFDRALAEPGLFFLLLIT